MTFKVTVPYKLVFTFEAPTEEAAAKFMDSLTVSVDEGGEVEWEAPAPHIGPGGDKPKGEAAYMGGS